MSFLDKLRGNKSAATLPRGAKVVRRRRRSGGSDLGYWHQNQFFLIDGTLTDSYDYTSGQGEVLTTREAQAKLRDNGYEADNYTAPSSSTYSDSSDRSPGYGTTSHTYSDSSDRSYGGGGGGGGGYSDGGYSGGGGGGGGYSGGGSSDGGGGSSGD